MPGIDKSSARERALTYIRNHYNGTLTPEIIDDQTIEKDYGWVFFSQTREYLATKNFRFSLLGNGPIIVDKQDGAVYLLTTAVSAEKSVAAFEERYKSR